MIDFLSGTLAGKTPVSISIDVNGVGYHVFISLRTYDQLPGIGEPITILTFLHVREDAMQLYGFWNEEERVMFRQLLGISGIGAKLAMTILSGCGADELRSHVAVGNVSALTGIPGIGRKTAERIIVELKDKIGKMTPDEMLSVAGSKHDSRMDALMALQSLGYSRQIAEKAILDAIRSEPGCEKSTSDLIRCSLGVLR